MAIANNEYLSLVPLGGLAIAYWMRDKYLYNRNKGKWYSYSQTQLRVLWMVWPFWIFLGWTLGMQTSRGQVLSAFVTTTGQHVVGHYTVIGVLNDSFFMTHQQLVSFVIGLVIAYIWTTFWLIITFSDQSGNVDHIVDGGCNCSCHG